MLALFLSNVVSTLAALRVWITLICLVPPCVNLGYMLWTFSFDDVGLIVITLVLIVMAILSLVIPEEPDDAPSETEEINRKNK